MIELRASFAVSSSNDADRMNDCLKTVELIAHTVEPLRSYVLLRAQLSEKQDVEKLLECLQENGFEPLKSDLHEV